MFKSKIDYQHLAFVNGTNRVLSLFKRPNNEKVGGNRLTNIQTLDFYLELGKATPQTKDFDTREVQ